jgi:hypothetical protein
MKCLMLLKNRSDEALNTSSHRFIASSLHCFIASLLHCFIASSLHRIIASSLHCFIASSLHCFIAWSFDRLIAWSLDRFPHRFIISSLRRCEQYINSWRNRHETVHDFPTHIWNERRRNISPLLREYTIFFLNCQCKSSLHRFYALISFFVMALRQWRQIRGAMKR